MLFRSAVTVLVLLPLSAALVEDPAAREKTPSKQSIPAALREAFSHRGFILMCLSYTVCGFQLLFVSVHFPAYLIDQKMTPATGMIALALIGLFNTAGSYTWGWLGGRYTKKYLLATLYFTRAMVVTAFILAPLSPTTVFMFSGAIGFLWLGTAPITEAVGQSPSVTAPLQYGFSALDYVLETNTSLYYAQVTTLPLRFPDRKSTRLNSSHVKRSRMPSSA